ncbi:hypothetical protein HK101_004328, partial [Irineochytrium annulatum]
MNDPRDRLIEILQRQATDLQQQNSDLRAAIDDLRDQMRTLTALLRQSSPQQARSTSRHASSPATPTPKAAPQVLSTPTTSPPPLPSSSSARSTAPTPTSSAPSPTSPPAPPKPSPPASPLSSWAQVVGRLAPAVRTALQQPSSATAVAALQRPRHPTPRSTQSVHCLVIAPRLRDAALRAPAQAIEALVVAATGLRPLLVSPVGRLASTAEIYVDATALDMMTTALKTHDLLLPTLPVPDRALDRLAHTYIRAYFPALRTAVLDRAGTHRSHLLDRALVLAPRDPIRAARLRAN